MNEQYEPWNEMEAIPEVWTAEDLQAYSEWLDQLEREWLFNQSCKAADVISDLRELLKIHQPLL